MIVPWVNLIYQLGLMQLESQGSVKLSMLRGISRQAAEQGAQLSLSSLDKQLGGSFVKEKAD